jgi:hypothetical protein
VALGVGPALGSAGVPGDGLGDAGEMVAPGFGLPATPSDGAALGVVVAAGREPEGAGVDDGAGSGATPRIVRISSL